MKVFKLYNLRNKNCNFGPDPNVTIGKYTYGANNIKFIDLEFGSVAIGSFCSIAGGVTIFAAGNHPIDQVTTYPFGHTGHMTGWESEGFIAEGQNLSKGPVSIGSDVWIGANSTIMSGIHIGHGAIIAANSHVVKNVEDYAIVGGNPAHLIRYRFTPNQIKLLVEMAWWNWDDEIIRKCQTLLSMKLTDEVLQELASYKRKD